MHNDKIAEFASLIAKSAFSGGLKNVTFHSPASGDAQKAKGVLKMIGGEIVMQIETFITEGRVTQANVKLEGISDSAAELLGVFKKADLTDADGTASLMISKKGAVTLLKKGSIGASSVGVSAFAENNREKKYLLTGEEKFLSALGVADKNGRIHDKKQSKFRQICRFSEYIVEAEKKLDREALICQALESVERIAVKYDDEPFL